MRSTRFIACLTVASFALILLFPRAVQAAPEEDQAKPGAQTAGISATVSKRHPKIGVALGGGGTRGLAHIAVLRELDKAGIKIDCIAGTSMGAIVGGLYATGMTPDQIEDLVRKKAFLRSYYTVPIPVRVTLVPLFAVPHLFGYHPYGGLYKGNKFAHYIDKSVPVNSKELEKLKIPFWAVAANLLDGKAHAIKDGDLGRALQASSAIPILRRPVPWQGKLFVDGGVIANVPTRECRQMGADIVIAVDVDERLEDVDSKAFRNIATVAFRCLNMHLSKIDEPQISDADVTIHPHVNGISLLSTSLHDLDEALHRGVHATQQAIPQIKQLIDQKLCKTDGD